MNQYYLKLLENFFSVLKLKIYTVKISKKEKDVYLASDFSLFNYFYPNERNLSDILRDILDPNGPHGQGKIFLDLFLKRININREIDERVKIIREDPTIYIERNRRSIDLTINFSDFTIGIENKRKFTEEQTDQLKDYDQNLFNKSKGKYKLIFISDFEPKSIPNEILTKRISEQRFQMITYSNDVIPWIVDCYRNCRAEKIRWFLIDFIEYLKSEFWSEQNVE